MTKGKTSRLVLAVVLAFLVANVATGQGPKSATPNKKQTNKTKRQSERQKSAKEGPEKLWLDRAEWLTEELRDEEWRLREQRPLLLARLAEAWWKIDIRRAKAWMDSAVGALEFQPQNESVADARRRIATAESVLKIALPLDRTYADRLLKTVTETIEHLADSITSAEDRRELSRLAMDLPPIAQTASREKDFDSADRIFRTLLKLKDGNHLQSTLMSIRFSDAGHADKLYAEALEAAKAGYDPVLIFGLAQLAYPSAERDPRQLPSEALRQRFLDLLAEAMLRVPQNDEEQNQICRLGRDGARLLDRYSAERVGAMETVLDTCKSQTPIPKTETADVEKKMQTVDDFLKAAEAEDDPWQRAFYKLRAAGKADEKRDFIRALEIVNGLTEEERAADPSWVSWHRDYQQDAVRELYKRHDYPGLQQLMDKSPRRPQTLLEVAQMLFEEKDDSFGLLILSEARRALEKTAVDEPLFYWYFLNDYAKHMPSETAAVLKEAVVGLNGIKPPAPDPNAKSSFWWAPLSHDLRVLPITPQVLDLEPQYVTATIKLLDSVQDRTTFRLSFLRLALQRYEQEKKQSDQQRRPPAPAKSKGRDSVAPFNH